MPSQSRHNAISQYEAISGVVIGHASLFGRDTVIVYRHLWFFSFECLSSK
jgi:hypothetical protein